MSRVSFTISLIGAALATAGCTMLNRQAASTPVVAPTSAARHGAGHGDAQYALGRYYQGQVRYDEAIRSYQKVIEAQPDHADAHNALGVIYATQGRHEMAETELRAALQLAPGAAHIQNNLGYALLLQGALVRAEAAFEEALRLDPSYSRAADNLRVVRAQLSGRPGEKQPAIALVPPKAREGAAVPSTPSPDMGPRLNLVAANIYELKRPPARQEPAAATLAAPAASALSSGQRSFRLEVANGNGVGGLAKQTSRYLTKKSYGVLTHITNQKPYDQKLTEIQFRPGFESQAMELQMLLVGKGVATQTSRLRQDVEVRLVLGQDLRRAATLAEMEARTVQLAAAKQ